MQTTPLGHQPRNHQVRQAEFEQQGYFCAAGTQLEAVERKLKLALVEQARRTAGEFRTVLERVETVRIDPTTAEAWNRVVDVSLDTIETAFAAIPCGNSQCPCRALADRASHATQRITGSLRADLARAANRAPPIASWQERQFLMQKELGQIEKCLAGIESVMTGGWRCRRPAAERTGP